MTIFDGNSNNLYRLNPSRGYQFGLSHVLGLHLEVLPMPTKAEQERQVKSLKLQLAKALAETRGTRDEEAEVTELCQCNEHLCSQLNKLQTQLERER